MPRVAWTGAFDIFYKPADIESSHRVLREVGSSRSLNGLERGARGGIGTFCISEFVGFSDVDSPLASHRLGCA